MSLFGNSVLAGSAGQGGADLGDTIEQSLRFSGSQNLTKTMAAGAETTFSCWVKIANLSQTSAMAFIGATSGTNYVQLFWEGATYETLGADNSNTSYAYTSNKLRDPSAWYHLVYVRTSSDTKVYINGAEASYRTSAAGSNGALSSTTFAIGSLGNGTSKLEGYMADVHFVESVKQPSDFGKYNEDGVWVPQDYTGSYGTNGFHLTFDSSQTPNGVGTDSSGNGNHFTATGFDTADVALYSPDVVSSTGSFYSGQGRELMFDGSSSTYTQSSTQGGTVTWTPSQTITYSSSVVVRSQRNAGDQCVFNGSTTVSMAAGGVPGETTIATGSGTISSMAFSGYYGGSVQYIKVDGTILVDNTDNDVDYFDTPTSNYATFNPSYPYPTASLSKANLRVDDSNGAYAPQTVASIKLDGKCYWEVIPTVVSSYPYVGVTILDPTLSSNEVFQQSLYVAADGGGGNFAVSISNNSFSTGTVLGFAYDSSNRQLTVTYDGTNSQTFTASGTAELAPMVAAAVNAGADVNYGQMPFLYTPPTGFSALQTNNLPEPTIKNGSDHFQAITGPGNGASSGTPGGGNWTPYLTSVSGFQSSNPPADAFDGSSGTYAISVSNGDWTFAPEPPIPVTSTVEVFQFNNAGQTSWNGSTLTPNGSSVTFSGSGEISAAHPITATSVGTGQACFCNKIAVDGDVLIDFSILTLAQAAFSNGLWWVKDRQNSNNHQLVSSEYSGVIGCPTVGSYQSNFPAYAAPSGNSVAWCWGTDATGLNKEAGFEIIQQLGTLTYTTVNHRLEKEPKMIIAFAGRGDLALTMYHASLGPNYRATMSSALQFYNEPAWWGGDPTDFTATTFGVGPTAYTNDNENFNGGMTYFVWTDIPGYSAFGDYVGNSISDGPYIYTGFRPSMILYKCATTTGNWHFRDTTRSIYNPAEAALYPNLSNAESTPGNSGNYVDILSNGFKIRNGDGDQNTSGQTYIWAAWAENPFGGEKQPPATAR